MRIHRLLGGVAVMAVACLQACQESDSMGNENIGEQDSLAFSIVKTNPGIWNIEGTVSMGHPIVDVSYALRDSTGNSVMGSIYAYSLQDATQGKSVSQLNLGKASDTIPGLEVQIYQSDMGGVCGTLTFEVQLTFDEGSGNAVLQPHKYSQKFVVICGEVAPGPEPGPCVAPVQPDLITKTALVLGGVNSLVGSSADLDESAVFAANEVTATVANKIDLVYRGTALMTPFGASEAGYLASVFSKSTSEAVIIPVDAAKAAEVKSNNDLQQLIIPELATNLLKSVTTGDAFIMITTEGIALLYFVQSMDPEAQTLTLESWDIEYYSCM